MTREQFERDGYRVLSCKANPKCHEADHIHCELMEGVEYCPDSQRILVLSTMIVGNPVHTLCMDEVRKHAVATCVAFEVLHPDWKLKYVAFV